MNRKVVYILFLFMAMSVLILGARGTNGYEIVAVDGSTPTIDGTVNSGEWSDASYVQFNYTVVYVKQDGVNLYVGFAMGYPLVYEPNATIQFDVDHDESKMLQSDDLKIWIFRNGTLGEASVIDWKWTPTTVRGWNAKIRIHEFSWNAEFNITYSKIEVVAGVAKTLGVAFLSTGNIGSVPTSVSWPPDPSEIINSPSNWGDLTSTGYNWIPEFPSLIILSLFMTVTLLTAIIYRRKPKPQS